MVLKDVIFCFDQVKKSRYIIWGLNSRQIFSGKSIETDDVGSSKVVLSEVLYALLADFHRFDDEIVERRTGSRNGNVILLPSQHNPRRAIVPRRDVPRHLRVLDPCQSKVADLQVAILVDEDVRRLEIAVHYAGRVDVLEAAENLVEEVLDKLFFERTRGEQTMEIGAEKFRNKVARIDDEKEPGIAAAG